MGEIGFSTGALAYGDFRRGLEIVREAQLSIIELSVLRQPEVEPFLNALPSLDLHDFSFVSIHAPSVFEDDEKEALIARRFLDLLPDSWYVVLHPDAGSDLALWKPFGSRLLVENMDKRKRTGRTAHELETVFHCLPEASLCFDVAHARQVDPTMLESWFILKQFGHKVREVHVSELNSQSKHRRLSDAAVSAIGEISDLIPATAALIIESPVDRSQVNEEVEQVRRAFPMPRSLVA